MRKAYPEQHDVAIDKVGLDKESEDYKLQNKYLFETLLEVLDEKTAKNLIGKALNDGAKALAVLKDQFVGSEDNNAISSIIDLIEVSLQEGESFADYGTRCTQLMEVVQGHKFDLDKFATVCVIRGIPDDYEVFKQVVKRGTWPTMSKLNQMLREEDSSFLKKKNKSDSILKANSIGENGKGKFSKKFNRNHIECFKCGKKGHVAQKCTGGSASESKKWCEVCKRTNHNTVDCRYKNRGKKEDSTNTVSVCSSDSVADSSDIDHRPNYLFTANHQKSVENVVAQSLPYSEKQGVKPENSDSDVFCENENFTKLNSLLVDTGATAHIIKDVHRFDSFSKNQNPSEHVIILADGTRTKGMVRGTGTATYTVHDTRGVPCKVTLTNALYIPDYQQNIFSVSMAEDRGAAFTFEKGNDKMKTGDGNTFKIVRKENLYYINSAKSSVEGRHPITEWHKKLGHANFKDINALASMVDGMVITDSKVGDKCEICVATKLTESRNRRPDKRATAPFELVHSDLSGHISTPNIEGMGYAISFVCDYSSMIYVYLLKDKTAKAVVLATEQYLADIAPYTSGVKRFRTDNGTEYTADIFQSLMRKRGIKQEFSAPHSPHQNGTAERNWRTLFETASSLLKESGVSKGLWPYALLHAGYLMNRRPNHRVGVTPLQAATETRPNLKKLETFGVVVHSYVHGHKKKFDDKTEEGIFVGYDRKSPGIFVYSPATRSVKSRRLVVFTNRFSAEDSIEKRARMQSQFEVLEPIARELTQLEIRGSVTNPLQPQQQQQEPTPSTVDLQEVSSSVGDFGTVPLEAELENGTQSESNNENFRQNLPEIDEQVTKLRQDLPEQQGTNSEATKKYPSRVRKLPSHLEDYYIESLEEDEGEDILSTVIANVKVDYCYKATAVPSSYKEAMASPEASEWEEKCKEEFKKIEDNETWEEVSREEAQGRQIVKSRIVFSVKIGENGEEHKRARVVAKGFSQVEGIDYHETFSPTVHMTSVRMATQVMAEEEMHVHQMDFNCAFLNSDIDKVIYMEPPPGYTKDRSIILKLKKSLYGLKQSGNLWNSMLNKFLINQGFIRSQVDTCVYTKGQGKSKIILLVWVDDLIIGASDMQVLNDFKKTLKDNFKMKDLGPLTYFLGIEFNCSPGKISMKQTKYIERILEKFRLENCNPKSLPCATGINTELSEGSKLLHDVTLYREMVGSLIYVMTGTRPDICYVVNLLAQHMASPTLAHLKLCKQVYKYLKGTKDYDLKFQKSKNGLFLEGWTDSDWGSSPDRRSISGYCYQLNDNGALISWGSCKQRIVALSSTEAEYVAVTDAMKEGNFLRQLLADMTGSKRKIIRLHADNQGAIALSKNAVHHKRTKHIDIRYHFIRYEVDNKIVYLVYVPTGKNTADMFTKPLPLSKLAEFSSIRG